MTVRYDKLWSLMKINKMKKSELAKAAEISQSTMTNRLTSVQQLWATMQVSSVLRCYNKRPSVRAFQISK